jgi:hypothetical protein
LKYCERIFARLPGPFSVNDGIVQDGGGVAPGNDLTGAKAIKKLPTIATLERGMLAMSLTEAARFIAERGVIEEGAPVLVRFITQVASRFGMVLTQKFAAQALPVVGHWAVLP